MVKYILLIILCILLGSCDSREPRNETVVYKINTLICPQKTYKDVTVAQYYRYGYFLGSYEKFALGYTLYVKGREVDLNLKDCIKEL